MCVCMFDCVFFFFYLCLWVWITARREVKRSDFTFLTSNSDAVVDVKQMIFTCFIIKTLRAQSVGAFMGQFTKSENTSLFFFSSWLLLCELQGFGDIGRADVCLKAPKTHLLKDELQTLLWAASCRNTQILLVFFKWFILGSNWVLEYLNIWKRVKIWPCSENISACFLFKTKLIVGDLKVI